MAGILPEATSGGVVTRDGAGVATNPANVQNAYVPSIAFTSTCELTGLPSDCTARVTPAQVNAIVSELMCLAVTMNPTGSWDCNSLCNLANNFAAFSGAQLIVDGVTIVGTGSVEDPLSVGIAGIISVDAGNTITVGVDGNLLVSGSSVVAAICADDPTKASLALCLTSADANNALSAGSDDGLMVSGSNVVTAICASLPARSNLATCLISGDAGNSLSSGVDGGLALFQHVLNGQFSVTEPTIVDPSAVLSVYLTEDVVIANSSTKNIRVHLQMTNHSEVFGLDPADEVEIQFDMFSEPAAAGALLDNRHLIFGPGKLDYYEGTGVFLDIPPGGKTISLRISAANASAPSAGASIDAAIGVNWYGVYSPSYN